LGESEVTKDLEDRKDMRVTELLKQEVFTEPPSTTYVVGLPRAKRVLAILLLQELTNTLNFNLTLHF